MTAAIDKILKKLGHIKSLAGSFEFKFVPRIKSQIIWKINPNEKKSFFNEKGMELGTEIKPIMINKPMDDRNIFLHYFTPLFLLEK